MSVFKKTRAFQMMLSIVAISILLAACGNSSTPGGNTTAPSAPVNGKGCTKVGVLLPETATSARWDGKDKPLLTQDIQAISGVTVDYYNAEGSKDTQQNQADQAITKGDCILVVAPFDAVASAAIVAKAKAKNIPVIAYDRLIQSKDLNFYVSFDGVKVGEIQGQYITDHYKDYVKGTGKNNLVMINGGDTDNNAHLFKQGAQNKLQPLIDSKELNLVYDQFTPGWDNDKARTEMDGVLTSQQNNVQIAYVANDGMANSVIASLKAKKLNGHVLVTGQDATVAGIQNILLGDQMMTVYKAIAKEAQATADVVKALHDGTDTGALTNGITTKTSDGGAVPSVLELPVAVDKTNILTTVIADNYVTKDEVCKNLPAGTGGVC
jgi:D-xylose transport system substrate-binding protein